MNIAIATNPAVNAVRWCYQRVFGADRTLSEVPLWFLRAVRGHTTDIRLRNKPFVVDLSDTVVSFSLLAFKQYEPEETALLEQLVQRDFRIVDVGAHIGYYSTLFAELAGENGRVLAIEPDVRNVAVLKRNIEVRGLGPQVDVRQGAAGATAGTLRLHRAKTGNRGDNRMYGDDTDTASFSDDTVEVFRVDDLVADWDRVDLIKMDIQGFEAVAIEGMRETLARCPQISVLSEFWPQGIRLAGADPQAYLNIYKNMGFSIWEVRDNRLEKIASLSKLVSRMGNTAYTNLLIARGEARFSALTLQ